MTSRHALALAALTLLGAAPVLPAQAADRHWSPTCASAFWHSRCWTPLWNLGELGAPPAAGDRALLRHVAASDRVVVFSGLDSPLLAGLEMDALGAGTLTLQQIGQRLAAQGAVLGGAGHASLRALGGQFEVTGGLLLGRDAGAHGLLQGEGGAVQAGTLELGRQGRGELQLQTGSLGVAGSLLLGRDAGAEGLLRVEEGAVQLGALELGRQGRGELQLRGGSLAVAGGWTSGIDSHFQWEGGSLQLGAGGAQWQQVSFSALSGSRVALAQAAGQQISAHQWLLGGQGRAQFTQTGGSVQVGKSLSLGEGNVGAGQFLQQGGSAQLQRLVLGGKGEGEWVQSGGALQVQQLELASAAGSRGVLRLEAGVSSFAEGVSGGAGFSELVWHSGVQTDLRRIQGLSRLHLRGAPDTPFDRVLDDPLVIDTGELALDGGLFVRQTGGQVRVRDNLYLGASREFFYTTYQLQGGLLDVGRIAGEWQTGRELRLEGGELRFGSELQLARLLVARTPGSRFALSLQADQLMNVSEMYLGHAEGGGEARFAIHGGELRWGSYGSTVRLYGDSQVMHGGGSVRADYLSLSGAQAHWVQRGGRLDVDTRLDLGGGRFAIEGGGFTEVDGATVIGGGANLDVQAGGLILNGTTTLGEGTVTVSGGRLTVRGHWLNGAGHGRLVWSGGRLLLEGTQLRLDALEVGHGLTLVRTQGQELQVGELLALGRLELANRSEIGRLDHRGTLLATGSGLYLQELDSRGTMQLHTPGTALQVSGDSLLREGASFQTYASTRLQFDGALILHPGVQIAGPGNGARGPQLVANGRVDLQAAGPAAIALDASLQLGESAVLRVDLGTGGADLWTLSGALQLGGTLQLVAGAGFAPQAGEQFTLFQAGSFGGSFQGLDSHAAPLAAGLRWDASQLGVDGTLRVTAVPEPQSWALMACGLALLLRRRLRGAA